MVIMVIADTQEGATAIIAATETPLPEKKCGGAAQFDSLENWSRVTRGSVRTALRTFLSNDGATSTLLQRD